MSILISKIETLFLEGSLEAICFATIIYLTRKGTTILSLNEIKGFTEHTVNASLEKISDFERRMKVLEMEIIYKNIVGLNAVKELSVEQEAISNHLREEIDRNLRALQSKLGAPIADTDIFLYSALKTNLISIDHSELTWRDPEANMIIADDSVLVKNLGQRQMQVFLKPPDVSKVLRNVVHNKKWKEKESKLIKRTNHILGVWNNLAFASSEIRGIQSKGTYVTDIIVPLLRASLEDLPNGDIFLSTAERQKRSTHKTPIGKKPDVMVMAKYGGKIFEIAYVESSRILCTRSKREDDSVEKPFTKNTSWRVEPLIRLLLTLRNIIIVNQSLLIQALEQANTHLPRNATQSPTVTSPSHK
ncbi:hypothetical protein Glove_16g109 [Diversispora epigaea]|uniref:Uncharacterized protein n=1 Tax=Diversispora epigaea TaxID=1348612 RepID=A0A397JVQ6_9GLOM|nr:hypothetical protein Glove_16g109 [Diversispora epigaea]